MGKECVIKKQKKETSKQKSEITLLLKNKTHRLEA